MKKRKQSFLSRKKLLSEEEYEEYQEIKKNIQKEKYKEEIKGLKKKQKQIDYSKTRSGKIGSLISKGIKTSRQGVTRTLYRQRNVTGKHRYSRPGRPKGTVKYTDPRTGQPIGVYEYRKILSARLRRERQEDLRSRAINPQQREILRRIEQRNQATSIDPERRTIPSTSGKVYIRGIMDEIDIASNLVQ